MELDATVFHDRIGSPRVVVARLSHRSRVAVQQVSFALKQRNMGMAGQEYLDAGVFPCCPVEVEGRDVFV